MLITEKQAERLVKARRVLKEIAEKAQKEAIALSVKGDAEMWSEDVDMFDLGRVAAQAEVAEDAVFQTLNVLSSHAHDPIAKEFLHVK